MKCDEAKPECERCKKATYRCAGYDQSWLNEAPFEREAHKRILVRNQLYNARHNAFLPKQALISQGLLPAEKVAQELDLSAFREDICRSFLFHRLCSGENLSKAISWWLNPTPRVQVQSRTLVSASKAMVAAFFGRIHQQPLIMNEGTKFYGEALRNLSSDLSHKVKAYTFETLGATMALNMYEMIHLTPDSTGLLTHAGGIKDLIYARGPELHKSYPEKEIYLEARVILVANAIFSCQRTFLEEQKWKDVPWEEDVSAKSMFDYIVDVLSDLPYFLQQVAHANISTATDLPERPDKELLQKQLLERLQILRKLRGEWHIKYSTPVWQVPVASASSQGSDSIRPPFDAAIHFADVFRAYEYCAYQMACILLFLLYQDLSPENLQPVEDILPGLFPHGSIQNVVCNICRCTEYLCHEQNGSRGYIVLQLPATIAYLATDKNSPEAKWLYHVCKKRARSSGFGWGEFAMDQVTPLSLWMASCRDRHRNAGSNGHFAVVRPCWAVDPKEPAIGRSASLHSDAALPLRAWKSLGEAVRNPS